jgi:phenylacetate-CoA ligase
VRDAAEGEVVVTLLRSDYPLVRFGTGDLSGWTLGPDGSLRLRGVLGRVGQAVKVKGMFLHPRQVTAVMADVPGVADYRFVIDRVDHKDELTCLVVADGTVPAEELSDTVAERVRAGLRFRADVRVVESLGDGDGPMVDRRDWS